jgi:NDP-sugar pyrophosphorylase family protein
MFRPQDLLDLTQFQYPELFDGCENVWEALPKIAALLKGKEVIVGKGTVVPESATIRGPAIIGANCEIRPNAFVRGSVIVGDNCVLGNACEFKNCVLFNGCQVPHFSYIGDSILGHKVHIGAGVILSNLKSVKGSVRVDGKDTGLRKFGAIVGDHVEIGCNCVLNPGSVIGRHSLLYPGVSWRGVCPPDSVVKLRQVQQVVARQS